VLYAANEYQVRAWSLSDCALTRDLVTGTRQTTNLALAAPNDMQPVPQLLTSGRDSLIAVQPARIDGLVRLACQRYIFAELGDQGERRFGGRSAREHYGFSDPACP
jgi:hypothetical protein